MSSLDEIAVDTAREGHPRIQLAIETLDAAKEVSTPELSFARFVAQRFERNCDLNYISVRANNAFRLQEQVDAEIFPSPLGEYAVTLYAERIEKYLKGPSLIIEGVEVKTHIVVAEDVVAFGDGGSNFVRLIERPESKIEKLRIVTQENLGRF